MQDLERPRTRRLTPWGLLKAIAPMVAPLPLTASLFAAPQIMTPPSPSPDSSSDENAAAVEGVSAPLVSPPDDVLDALIRGGTDDVMRGLEALVSSSPKHEDAWTVYAADALVKAERLGEAFERIAGFEERFPKSPWVSKVRFLRADLASLLDQPAVAEEILREEARALRSRARRDELSGFLLDAAKKLAGKADRAPSPDQKETLRQRAAELLERAEALETTEERTRQIVGFLTELATARAQWQDVARWGEAFGELHPEGGPEEIEGALTAATGLLELGDPEAARKVLIEARVRLDKLAAAADADRLQDLSGSVSATLGDAWAATGRGLFAVDAWRSLMDTTPAHREAGRVAERIALTYASLGRVEDALATWEAAAKLPDAQPIHPDRPFAAALFDARFGDAPTSGARRRHAVFARAQALHHSARFDEALEGYQGYVEQFPGGEEWSSAQAQLVRAEFDRAATLLERSEGDRSAAAAALLEFAADHPLNSNSGEALFLHATLPLTWFERFGEGDGAEQDEQTRDLRLEAVARLEELARRSGASDPELAGRALLRAAMVLENDLEEPARAAALYSNVVGSSSHAARERLEAMEETNLSVETTGLIRPGSPIAIDVLTRNVEGVTVQAVKLDLGQYFQRHGSTEGIHRLDLDLIAPDVEAELEVEDYQPYAQLRRTVKVPVGAGLEEPGVYAVTVIADKKRSTTLVVKSDLDLIVKRSGSEVFAFVTQWQPSGDPRPAKGVEIVVSYEAGEKRETQTLETNADGAVSFDAPEGVTFGDDTRVFAARDGHVAATRLRGRASGSPTYLGPRAHVTSDRSAYRPGETLEFRAVMRTVKDGTWALPMAATGQGARYSVELVSPGGVVVARRTDPEVSEFGTLHGSLEIDRAAPSGQWTLRALGPSGLSAATFVTIGEIETPRETLALEPSNTVVQSGETVTLEAVARTSWGAPLAGVPIVWRDPNGVETRGVTDDEGRASLEFDTRLAVVGESLVFTASLPENQGLQATTQVAVSLSALELKLVVDRDVVLAGETFQVTVEASAPDGKSVATEVRVTGTRTWSPREGRYATEDVIDETVTTDEDGRALLSVSSAKGGQLSLRATAKDRFGREVETQSSLFVSGSEDEEKLRVLGDQALLSVGERGSVRVVDRAGGGLALLTIEGSKILEHRIVQLDEGTTTLDFEASASHVPDVIVSVAAIRGAEFFERGATFRVSRPLEIQLEGLGDARPGTEAQWKLTATDGLGQPVEAEFSLALVDAALLDVYPRRTAALGPHFRIEGKRTPAFVSASSSTFSYRGITKDIDAAILAEEERARSEAQRGVMRDAVGASLGDDMLLESSIPQLEALEFEDAPVAQAPRVVGVGGGAGGKYGGRFGGKKRSARPSPKSAPEVGFENPTAYWNASVKTGADGTAVVRLALPAREGGWQLTASGVTKDHRFGTLEESFVTSSPMVVTVDAPAYLNEGDQPRLRAEVSLMGPSPEDDTVELELRVQGLGGLESAEGAGVKIQRATVALPEGTSVVRHVFDALPAVKAESGLVIELLATRASDKDQVARDRRGAIVRPAGYPVAATRVGRVSGEETVTLELPGADPLELTLVAGATEAQWLVDAALRSAVLRGSGLGKPVPVREFGSMGIASQLLGAATLLGHSQGAVGLGAVPVEALRERCDGLISGLVARVGPDGGWSREGGCWRSQDGGVSDAATTARAIVALQAAVDADLILPTGLLDRALSFAQESLPKASDDEARAELSWALAAGGVENELGLNRLHRERNRLSPAARASLALALVEANKLPMAKEATAGMSSSGEAQRRGRLEAAALMALAKARCGALAPEDLAALKALRPWWDAVGRGLAIAAFVDGGALGSADLRPITFEVRVGSGAPTVVQLRPEDAAGGGARELSLLLPEGAKGPLEVHLKVISGPPLDYALALEGFSETIPGPVQGFPARIGAVELRAPRPRWRGRPLDEGFRSVEVNRNERFGDTITELEFGGAGRLQMSYRRPSHDGTTEGRRQSMLEDMVLSVPLPAGAAVVLDPHSTSSRSAKIEDGMLQLWVPEGTGGASVTLDMTGIRPGVWTLPAPMIRSALDPERVSYGKPTELTVLAPGEKPSTSLKPTPDERLSRGREAFADKDMAAVTKALMPLFEEYRRALTPTALAECARLLLFAALAPDEIQSPNAVVEWFEILKERDPDLFVSFDDTLQIADAYRSIGEPSRAIVLFKAVIEETLGEDMRVPRAMDAADEWLRATRLTAAIWRRYPDSADADDADLALSDRLIKRGLSQDDTLGAEARSALVKNGISRLRRKLYRGALESTATADAGLALVATYAQLEQWSLAAERAALLGTAFESPLYRDSFRYSESVARWSDTGAEDAQAQEAQAVKLLEDIAEKPLVMENGGTRWSPNRDLALYILAQIYHAGQNPEKAEEYYGRVSQSFSDARTALQELDAERLELGEEVVRIRPGEAAVLPFSHKGIETVEVLVYPVDLMTLAIRERDLSRVTAVDLAGVTPTLRTSMALERTVLHPSDGEISVALDSPGAYLAMLRGGEVHRSALLLASNLDLDVVLGGDGSVRAQALNAGDRSFAQGASMRIIDEASDRIESLETDRRGIAAVDGMQGRVTVIARTRRENQSGPPEDHYAFFGSSAPANEDPASQAAQPADKQDMPGYFSNVFEQNDLSNSSRQQRFDENVLRTRKGVQVQQAR